jgi:hypothetical protein
MGSGEIILTYRPKLRMASTEPGVPGTSIAEVAADRDVTRAPLAVERAVGVVAAEAVQVVRGHESCC